jgi:hypothetical protein
MIPVSSKVDGAEDPMLTTTTMQTDLQVAEWAIGAGADGSTWMFELPSPMQLVVAWGGVARVFDVIEFGLDEIVVVGFDVEGLDLAHHDAVLELSDDELLDEVGCHVALRRFEAEGVARLRVIAHGWARMELVRMAESMRQRMLDARGLEHARVAAACGWI